jgi:Sulfotransferase domain
MVAKATSERTQVAASANGWEFPNFLVIGAMKAGTTSLYHYLRSHPEIYMPSVKELDFFVEEGNWTRGFPWYQKQFEAAPAGSVAVGEASTRYTRYPQLPGVPERIAAHFPRVRLIYVVRNPIERIRSHYEHRVRAGSERATMEQAIRSNPAYIDCSRYAMQVDRYLRCFPAEQLMIITAEDLLDSRESTIRRVYEFLGVQRDFVPQTLDREFYKTEDRATYSPRGWQFRRALKRKFPATKRAKELVDSVLPQSVNRLRSGIRSEERAVSFEIPESLRVDLAEQLKDDVGRLRRHMPEGFDGWDIA